MDQRMNPNLILKPMRPGEQSHDLITDLMYWGYGPGTPFARITGGCAQMTSEFSRQMIDSCVQGFSGWRGPMGIGGNRMVITETGETLLGICELPHLIAKGNSQNRIHVIGASPLKGEIQPYGRFGCHLLEEESSVNGVPTQITNIVHPELAYCFLIQYGVDQFIALTEEDKNKFWWEEWRFFLNAALQAKRGGMKPFLFAYNGGGVTEVEILEWLKHRLPVFVVRNSGRRADDFAKREHEFNTLYAIDNDASTINETLRKHGFIA